MRIFFALFFTFSLSLTTVLPLASVLSDSIQKIDVSSINEEEEQKESKLEIDFKDFLVENCVYSAFAFESQKISSLLNSDTTLYVIYRDVCLPPPKQV